MKREVIERIAEWVEDLKVSSLTGFGYETVNAELASISEDEEYFYFTVKIPRKKKTMERE